MSLCDILLSLDLKFKEQEGDVAPALQIVIRITAEAEGDLLASGPLARSQSGKSDTFIFFGGGGTTLTFKN